MLYTKKFLLLSLLSIVIAITATAQTSDIFKKIPPNLLRQDFLLMRDTLQKVHAGLYRYKSKAEMDRVFDSCFATINDSMPVTDFYALTSYVIAAVEDGHSNCKLPGGLMKDYMANVNVFPAMVMFIHNRAFVFCCKQNDDLTGGEILSVNNHPMNEIVQRLFKYIASDGSIQSRKNWEMPEFFQVLFNILYGTQTSFNVRYKTKAGETKTTTLQADLLKNIFCTNPFPRPSRYLNLRYTHNGIAVLTLKSFFDGFLEQTGENFRQFLDSAFKDINGKHIKKILIDVRSNQGGNDGNGEILYSYLTQKPFLYYTSQETVTEKITESHNSNLGMQQPSANSYTGKVYVLINGRSFSGVAEFSSIVRSNNRGVFIGEECGGGYYGNTSGNEYMVALPNTQIICRVPIIKYTMAVKKAKYKDRGVIPDYPAYHTINDIIEHKDSQMDYALKVVGEK